jgi:hypothetical protein
MRPPPVKRQSTPLTASGCFFRAITASKVHPRPRGLTSFLWAGASRAAAPDTYRGSIAAWAAMAADRSADRCALEILRCPHTVLGNARAERRAFASQDQARGRSSTRVRDDRLLSISSSRRGRPHNAQGSRTQAHHLKAHRPCGTQQIKQARPRRCPTPAETCPYRTSFGNTVKALPGPYLFSRRL